LSHSPDPAAPAAPTATPIPEDRLRLLFALLFSSQEAVTLDRIRQVLYPVAPQTDSAAATEENSADEPAAAGTVELASPRQHLLALEAWIEERDLPLVLHQVGRSYRLLTTEEYAEDLQAARKASSAERIGPAALEVLALVAYRQPLLKADIDAIRGVKSGGHLRHLLDLRLVRILGRAELPGRPFLYGTTANFLDRFGLRDLTELPEAGRLASPAEPGVGLSAPVEPELAPPPTEAAAAAVVEIPEDGPTAVYAEAEQEPADGKANGSV